MGSAAIVSNNFESLPARPPTPPRDLGHGLNPLAKPALSADPTLSLQTPPNGHEADPSSSSTSRRKRVGFSAQAEYKEIAPYPEGDAAKRHPTPISLPSSSARPAKSILKATATPNRLDPITGAYFDISNPGQINIATMLDSTIQQLAGGDRSAKLDAYMMLVRALKVSNNLPDRIALQDKMSLFMQFIQREMTAKNPDGSMDSSLVNHALNLLSTFLHFPAIASTLSNDFGVFIVDHCVRSFEDEKVPKDVIRHLMQVMAFQNFSPKVMTSDRVGRLVGALHKIEEHMTGKSIIMSRIHIYRKLVKQCKQQMLVHTDWLLDLFTDMLSSMKEIRSSAIALGLDAAFTLGGDKLMARRVMEILQLTFQERKYIEYYADQLTSMVEGKTESASVPQIWSVVVLLLPGPEKWDFFLPWLKIIQSCFNSPDYQTKQEANYAWCRLTYKMQLDDRAFAKMIATLSGPLASQLKRRSTGKHAEDLRRVVLGSICNIFYYAFKPNSNLTLLDKYWGDSVKPLMERLLDGRLEKAKDNMMQASAILAGLFDNSTPRLWKEDHVVDKPLVKPEELPAVDAKWIRRNAPKVFEIVSPILEAHFLDLATHDSTTHKLWSSLVRSVASAASKEIKVSVDTATFMAHAFGVLMRIWTKGVVASEDSRAEAPTRFLDAAKEFVLTLIDSLGILPFTEKLLMMSKPNSFVPVATPSHRTSKAQGLTKSPLLHLFSILCSLPAGVPDDERFADFLQPIFAPFFDLRGHKAQSEFAQELLQTTPPDSLMPFGPWVLVASKIEQSLEESQHSHQTTSFGSEPPLGHEYRDITKVLERGLRSTPNLPWSHWQLLFASLCDQVRDDAGDAGVAIVVIEPLAKSLMELVGGQEQGGVPSNHLDAAVELVTASTHPRDRQAVEAARRRLWGSAMASSRTATFDPSENVYKLQTSVLGFLYDRFEEYDPERFAAHILGEIASFLDRCNKELLVRTLALLQDGLAPWVQDARSHLNARQSPAAMEAVNIVCEKICTLVTDFDRPEGIPLAALEKLLCAAFESKHRHVVNTVATMWNRAFEGATEIPYPSRLRDVLMALHSFVDLALPGLDLPSSESAAHQPAFLESQDDALMLDVESARSTIRSHSRPASSHQSSPVSLQTPEVDRRRADATPASKLSRSSRRSATLKLRHDDSQVQFAAIESSPVNTSHDSQHLTERQREVRERQKENAALFPEIRSSPAGTTDTSARGEASSLPIALPARLEQDKAATPEPDAGFEDYLASTPTPRRGQPLSLADQEELPELTSSPLAPRRYPLLSELQSRSNSGSLLDEWQFSSSPVSGSPNPEHDTGAAPPPMELDEAHDRLQLDSVEPSDNDDKAGQAPPHLDEEGARVSPANAPAQTFAPPPHSSPSLPPTRSRAGEDPLTPSRRLRSTLAHGSESSDVHVDAPAASPVMRTPRHRIRSSQPTSLRNSAAAASLNQSFEASDVDERSMMRIATELESRRAKAQPSDAEPPSPRTSNADEPQAQDCITVGGEKKTRGRPRKQKAASSPAVASSPVAVEEETTLPSSQESTAQGGRRRTKRKRSHSKAPPDAGGSSKKPRQDDASPQASPEVPDSQAAPAAQDVPVQTAELLYENDVSSFSGDVSAEMPSMPELDSELAAEPAEADAMEVDGTDNDEDVQSQIAKEASAMMERGEEQAEPAEEEAGVAGPPEEAGPRAPSVRGEDGPDAAETPKSKLGELMGYLRSGLDMLRSARLSREEVYEVEDMFMDMKRELFEAERRGRQERQ